MLKYAIAMIIITAIAGKARADKEFSFRKTNNFDGAAVKTIKVDMDYGQISLVKSSGSAVDVDYKNTVYAAGETEASDLDKECKYTAELSGDQLLIRVETPHKRHRDHGVVSRIIEGDWNEDIYPMVRVSIPGHKGVEINSASADIDGSEIDCDLNVRSASSDISLENTTGNVDCDISSGDIDITGHKGQISLHGQSSDLKLTDIEGNLAGYTASGDVSVDKVKGPVKVSTTSGDCRIYDVDGDLDVSTASGDIVTSGVSGLVRADAISGDIKLAALSAPEGDFDVQSVSGDVQMEISPDFRGEVSLRSVSGDVNSKISGELTHEDDRDSSTRSVIRGTVGSGKGRLNVVSTSGDIDINRF